MKRLTFSLALLLAVAVFAGCQEATSMDESTPTEAPFNYSLQEAGRIHVTARIGDEPAERVVVSVRRPAEDGQRVPGVIWRGVTNAEGIAKGDVALRADEAPVELVLNRRGLVGPYSDEELRQQHGFFAPSSWVVLPPAMLNGVVIELEEE